jgi:hypothetical protein
MWHLPRGITPNVAVFHKELNRTVQGNTASFARLSPGLHRILRSTYTLAAIRGDNPFP